MPGVMDSNGPLWPGGSQAQMRIGDCWVDVEGDLLLRHGQVIKLEPRLMRLLFCLASQPGHVVPMTELLGSVWPDVVVTPESIYQAVAALRRALGDDGHHPTYIATVPRKGYRLIAAVRWVAPPEMVSLGAAPEVVGSKANTESPMATNVAWVPPNSVDEEPQAASAVAHAQPDAGNTARWWPGWTPSWIAVLATAGVMVVGGRIWLSQTDNAPSSLPEVVAAQDTRSGVARSGSPPAAKLVLWVDDKPHNNTREREAMAALGVGIVLARSTEEALATLGTRRFDLVISDQRRPGDQAAGFTLLSHMRHRRGDLTPFLLYTSECAPEETAEAHALGALACSTQVSELMQSALVALEAHR